MHPCYLVTLVFHILSVSMYILYKWQYLYKKWIYLHNFVALKLLLDVSQDIYSPLAGTKHIINYLQELGRYCMLCNVYMWYLIVYVLLCALLLHVPCSVPLCSYAVNFRPRNLIINCFSFLPLSLLASLPQILLYYVLLLITYLRERFQPRECLFLLKNGSQM